MQPQNWKDSGRQASTGVQSLTVNGRQVYAAFSPSRQIWKFGRTDRFGVSRVKDLRSELTQDFELVATLRTSNGKAIESLILKTLSPHLAQGREWFRDHDDCKRVAAAIKAGGVKRLTYVLVHVVAAQIKSGYGIPEVGISPCATSR